MTVPTINTYMALDGSTWRTSDADITWTQVAILDKSSFTSSRGRDSELDDDGIGTFSFTVDNSLRHFDPSYTAGPYRKTYLNLTGAAGSYAETPDHASLDITGDIDIRAKVALTDWTPATNSPLVAKWNATGNQLSYQLRVTTSGSLQLLWSTTGAVGGLLTADSTTNPSVADGDTLWVRATLDVVSGANRVITFYTSTDATDDHTAVTWSQLGSTVTTAGTTSIFAGTATLRVGARSDGVEFTAGTLYAAAVLNGIGGTVAAAPKFTINLNAGGTSHTDTTGKVWTVSSPASLVDDGTYLEPGLPVKVEAVANATTYPVARGFADGFPQEYLPGNTMGTVTVRCQDGTARLGKQATSESMFADALRKITVPERWYPLTDSRESSTAVDVGLDGAHGNVFTNVAFGGDSLDGGGTSATFTTTTGDPGIALPDRPGFLDTSGSALFLVQSTTPGTVFFDDHGPNGFLLGSTGAFSANGSFATTAGGPTLTDGEPHLVIVTWDFTAVSFHIYADGTDILTGWVTGTSTSEQAWFNTIGPNFTGNLQHLVFTSHVITAAEAESLAGAASRLAGQTTGAGIDNLLDLAGWPSDLRDLAAGISELGPTTTGQTIQALIKSVEAVEQGRFFFSRSGDATFLDRYYHLTEPEGSTPQATFSDDGSGNAYSGLAFDYDLTKVFRTVRGSKTNGVVITRTTGDGEGVDSSLIGNDFLTDTEVVAAIEHRLGRYSEPQLRAKPLTIKLHSLTAAQQAAILALELGYRVTLSRTPQLVGSAITQETVVEHIAHRAGGAEHFVTLQLSPIETRDFFILDTSRLNGADVLAY